MKNFNNALRNYQIIKPKQKFYSWLVDSGYIPTFTNKEIKESREISKAKTQTAK